MIKKYVIMLTALGLLVLSGCTGVKERQEILYDVTKDEGITVSNDLLGLDEKIILSLAGFEKDGSKKAILINPCNETGFKVIDSDNKEVYEGRVRYKTDSTYKEEPVGICDFSSVTDEGSYHIKTDSGTLSDEFIIKGDLYREVLAERISYFGSMDEENKVNRENIPDIFLRVTDRLLTGEFFPESEDGGKSVNPMVIPRTLLLAKSDIEDLKELSDKEGKIKAYINADTGIKYQYSGVMAFFSYEYRDYDKKYAGECMDIAQKVYENAEKDYKDAKAAERKKADDKRFFASAQLYKLTGKVLYKQTAEEYAMYPPVGFNRNKCGYLGTIAYLTSYNRIDLNLAELFITSLMEDINDVVRESFKDEYLVNVKKIKEDDMTGVYEDARLAVLGNYISKNIKYVESGENQLAYLYGRNALGKDYGLEPEADFYDEPQMFILAGLIDSYIYEDKEPEAMGK